MIDKILHSKKYNCEHQETTYKNDCKIILSDTSQPKMAPDYLSGYPLGYPLLHKTQVSFQHSF